MSEMMRAVVVRSHGGPHVLEPATIPIPSLRPDEVRVRVRSAAVNFRDVQMRRRPLEGAALPYTPGSDFAGEVVEVGAGVSAIRVGARVLGAALAGAYAEQVAAPASTLLPLPADVGYDAGAILPVAGLSASFLHSAVPAVKGAIAVTYAAAGGLGCFLGGLLRASGARSIGLVSTAEKAAVARAAGHDQAINYRAVDPVHAVRELTDGRGADVVFDSVAGPEFGRSFRMLRNGGVVVLCGRAAGEPRLDQAHGDFVGSRRNLALREFSLLTATRDHESEVPARLRALLDGLRDGRLHVPLSTFPLQQAARAHRLLETGASTGKLVLHP